MTDLGPILSPTSKPFNIEAWNKKIRQAESLRNNNERQWYYNLAFYRGNQWVAWVKNPTSSAGFSLTMPKTSRKRLVFNKIRPVIRNEFTKLCKEEPQAFVRPNTTEQGDVAAAKTAEAIAEYLQNAGKFNAARRSATWWSSVTGLGYLKTWYNEGLKLPATYRDGNLVDQEPGSVDFTGISPFHIFVPYLDVEDIQEQGWVCHARTYDEKVVQNAYDKKVKSDTDSAGLGYEQRFLSAINVAQTNRFKQVHVKEVWIRPCVDYPDGKLVVFAGQEELLSIDFPYMHKMYPFQKICGTRSGGYYPTSVIEDLIPMQKEYNLTRSQLAEARDLTSKPALTVTRGSVDVKKVKAVPGLIIEVQPGGEAPKRLVNPDMPAYVMEELDRTTRDMDESSGQFEVTKGRTPPGIEAASAIAYLQEENDTRLYDTIASIEEAVSDSGTQALQLVQQYWDANRIVKTISNTHLQGTLEFKGADLKNNVDYHVVSGSMAPRSAAAKQAFILEAIKMQLIPPEVGLKHLPLSDTDSMYNEIHIDANQADRENLRMARGEAIEPNEWDNHITHVHQHEIYMKSQDFELLPPEGQQIYIDHREKHMTIELAKNMAQAEPDPSLAPEGQNGPGSNAESVVPGDQPNLQQ